MYLKPLTTPKSFSHIDYQSMLFYTIHSFSPKQIVQRNVLLFVGIEDEFRLKNYRKKTLVGTSFQLIYLLTFIHLTV